MSSKTTLTSACYEVFLKRSNLLLLWLFIGFDLFFKVLLKRSLPLIFSVSWSLSSLLVIVIIKAVTLYNLWLSTYTILYFVNVEDQLNSRNLQMKLCMRHPHYSLELSFVYIPVHSLDSYKCKLMIRIPICDSFWNKFDTQTQENGACVYFFSASIPIFFLRTDSFKSCIKQPQSYLKGEKITN